MTNATPFGASPPFGSEPVFGASKRFGSPTEASFAATALPCVGGNCGDAVQVLYPFLDGELNPEQHSFVQAHLDDCPSCISAFGFERLLRNTVRTKLNVPVPTHLAHRIRMALAADSTRQGPHPKPSSGATPESPLKSAVTKTTVTKSEG
jgi:anti-sigma factor (TIGR02949 family)